VEFIKLAGIIRKYLYLRRIKMKKNLSIVSVLLIALVIIGCSSGPKVYDKSVSMEQSSTLIIHDCGIFKFNGENTNIDWKAGGALPTRQVIIPAGSHELLLSNIENEYDGLGRVSRYKVHELPVSYKFLPGHTYLVTMPITTAKIRGIIIDVAVFDHDLVANPSGSDATPFEGKWANIDNEKVYFIFSGNEYATVSNNVNTSRGLFTFDDIGVTLYGLIIYNKGKWSFVKNNDFGLTKLIFNGTSLSLGKTVFKKVE
jgi:hypothetical protein